MDTRSKMNIGRVAIWIAVSGSQAYGQTVTFQGIGDLSGGVFSSEAYGVSGDGRFVVGRSASGNGSEAYVWLDGVMTPLGDLDGGPFDSAGFSISLDGSVIAGIGRSASNDRAVVWRSGVIGELPQFSGYGGGAVAKGVSADGTIVHGYNTDNRLDGYSRVIGFRYESGGLTPLGNMTGTLNSATGYGPPSGDGRIIAGRGANGALQTQACYWDGHVVVPLGGIDGSSVFSNALATSDDGRVIVGVCRSSRSGSVGSEGEACRWRDGAPLGLGNLPGGSATGIAFSATRDGSVVVGMSITTAGYRAFIWTEASGMRDLQEVLANDLGIDMTGWILTDGFQITADGGAIIGNGVNPSGNAEGWIVRGLCMAIGTQPSPVETCLGGGASFTVGAAGIDPVRFQWRHSGMPIDVLEVPSAATATVVLANVSMADAGTYDCVVTGACGSIVSDAVTLTVCGADYNCDGFVDFFDYDDFVLCFEGVACGLGRDADVNGDGFVDFFDYDDYAMMFAAGC